MRDRFCEEEGAPQEVGREHGLVLALRRDWAMIPGKGRYAYQVIGR